MTLEGKPHPLYIPSVVNQIMSYLTVSDLLRLRHVCNQWNEEASKYLRHRVKLKIYRCKEINQVCDVMKKSQMFKFPLTFDRIHLEARLSPIPPKSRTFQLFFNEFAPQLKSLSIKQSWDTLFPLNRLPQLEELSIYGNLNKHAAIFPPMKSDEVPYLPNLKRAYFYLEGRITTTNALRTFHVNITTLLKAAPNLEEIVAPKKIDHRDETAESYRDDTANHIFLHMLATESDLKLLNLKVLRIDAKLMDYDLSMLSRSAKSLPQLDTLGIALSGAATRTAVVTVLQNFSPTLKDLSISYSKTHGTRMSLESFFLHESPLRKLESLYLKNYPASVCFLGAVKQLKTFRIEVRNIGDCFDNDRDDFFLQPTPFIPFQNPSSAELGESSKSKQGRRRRDEEVVEPASKKSRGGFLRVDPSKAHGLRNFHYIHNKEGTQINLYGDRCPFVVTRRIAMRFPQLTHLTLDNMTGDSMTCIIKYLPLLEQLTAVGGFYNDLSIVGASSREEMLSSDFPVKRKLPYIGDLKYLHTLTLSTFSMDSLLWDKTDLLSEHCIYYGIIDCHKLRRLTLGNDNRGTTMRSKFETAIGDEPILDLVENLNLTYLKTVRCPLTSAGFQKILTQLRNRGVEYSINSYEGPILPEEFHRKTRQVTPMVQIKRLTIRTTVRKQPRCTQTIEPKPSTSTRMSTRKELPIPTVASTKTKRRRKRRYGTYKF